MQIGDKIPFCPSAFIETQEDRNGKRYKMAHTVTGRVTYIHPEGRYYTVEATVNGYTVRENFKCGETPKI